MLRRPLTLWNATAVALAVAAISGLGLAGSATAKSSAPFRLGVVGSFSGGLSSAGWGVMPQVVTAWSKYISAHGGLNGHPVKVFLKDDADNASTALQDVETLVKSDHIQALVDLSGQDASFVKYIASTGVPVTGGTSQNTSFTSNADFFPSGGGAAALGYGAAAIAKGKGDNKFGGLVCAESPVCAGLFAPLSKTLTSVIGGMSLSYSDTVAESAPSYTAQCLAAKQAGVQAMLLGLAPPVVTRVMDECAQQGIKFDYIVPGGSSTSAVTADPNANGLTTVEYNVPADNMTTPGGKLFNQILNKYAAGIRSNTDFEDNDTEAFAGLQLFATDVTTNHLTPSSSPAKVKAGLYKLAGTTLGGLAPALKFVKGKQTIVDCWFDVEVNNHKAIQPLGPKAQCVPKSRVSAVNKIWGA